MTGCETRTTKIPRRIPGELHRNNVNRMSAADSRDPKRLTPHAGGDQNGDALDEHDHGDPEPEELGTADLRVPKNHREDHACSEWERGAQQDDDYLRERIEEGILIVLGCLISLAWTGLGNLDIHLFWCRLRLR